MGAGSATTRAGGLVLGHGAGENVEEAYGFLLRANRPGDEVHPSVRQRVAATEAAAPVAQPGRVTVHEDLWSEVTFEVP